MPYLPSETVKEIRTAIKREFKNYKFSITGENGTTLRVCILESDIDFNVGESGSTPINHKWFDKHYQDDSKARKFLTRIMEIINSINPEEILYEDSDYGSVPNYYISMSAGKWDKPYKLMKD